MIIFYSAVLLLFSSLANILPDDKWLRIGACFYLLVFPIWAIVKLFCREWTSLAVLIWFAILGFSPAVYFFYDENGDASESYSTPQSDTIIIDTVASYPAPQEYDSNRTTSASFTEEKIKMMVDSIVKAERNTASDEKSLMLSDFARQTANRTASQVLNPIPNEPYFEQRDEEANNYFSGKTEEIDTLDLYPDESNETVPVEPKHIDLLECIFVILVLSMFGCPFSAIGISLELRKKRWWEGYASYIWDICCDETESCDETGNRICAVLGIVFILLFPFIIKIIGKPFPFVGEYYVLIVCWIISILIHLWLQLWAAKVSINCRTQKWRKRLKIIGILLILCFWPPISTVGIVFLIMNWKKISYENIDNRK